MEYAGLQSKEIPKLRQQFGFNEIELQTPVSPWIVFARQWDSPLIWLLALAAVLSIWLGEGADAVAILVIMILNVSIGFFQEWRAEKALLALRSIVPLEAKVVRDGTLQSVLARELLPGDIVQVEAGDRLPADGRILEKAQIALDESVLTGESFPVEDAAVVRAGTFLTRGALRFMVESTGRQTEFGKTADLLGKTVLEETPLQRRLAVLSQQILIFCSVMAVLVIAVSLYQGRNYWDVLLFGISLLVASVPEGLPVMVSLGLALGVLRMARKKVLVRRLAAVETLGHVNFICSDKTGTLTQGQLELVEVVAQDKEECLRTALACSEASIISGSGVGDPLEQAVARAAWHQLNLHREEIEKNNLRRRVEPFDSDTRSMKIERQDGWTYWKGASEVLWQSLSGAEREFWQAQNELWTAKGFRTLGVAKISPQKQILFCGILVFADPPRPEAKEAVARAHEGGITTLMLTGDQESTARSVAEQLNIHQCLARVKAVDKLVKVRELKEQGNIVAMTGDGVNDAPALKEAHVGVSMGLRGSEVAREASDIVLLDDNFASLVEAIKEGRGIFLNIRRSVSYLLVGNWGELILITLCSLLGFPIPLMASQLLWINLLTDGLPGLVLMLERASPDVLKEPPRPRDEPLLRKQEWIEIVVFGTLEALVVFGVFTRSLNTLSLVEAQTLAFFVLVWSEVLRLLNFAQSLRFWQGPHRFSARIILLVVGLSLGLQSLLVYSPWARRLLRLSLISSADWTVVLLGGLALPALLFIYKLVRRKPCF